MITATAERLNWIRFVSNFIANIATTSCKKVETLPRKNDLSCFKLLLVTGLWDKILTSLLPPIQSCSSKFWVWSCIARNFDKGGGSQAQDHGHGIYAKIRYSVSSTFATGCRTYKSVKYSETAPYGLAKTTIHFLLKKQPLVNTATPLIRPNFFGLLVTVLTGFHSIGKFSGVEFPSATLKFRIRKKNSLYCSRTLFVMVVLQWVQRQRKVLN